MNKCKGCEWYGKPYWSIINPCDNCPREIVEGKIEVFTRYIDPTIEELKQDVYNLQQENKQLKERIKYYENPTNYFKYASKQVVDENKQLKERIDKAIEYIENHLYMESDYGMQHPTLDGKMDYKTDGFELIQILKGDSNE